MGEYAGENMLMSGPSMGMKMAVGASSGRPSGGSSEGLVQRKWVFLFLIMVCHNGG